MLGGASLNGAQVASLINVINAVAMGAVSKEGAVSIITAAFPTISPDQARAIIAGVNIGTTIPTTKEEKQQIAKDQEGDTSGGSTPPAPEPTTPPTAPTATSQKKSSLEILESLDPASIKMLIEGMMGGIELAKYDGIDFTPPEGAREAAKRALDVRETKPPSQRGMTPVGIARARDLQNGVKLSPDTVRRMLNFLTRHEVDKKGSTWDEQGKGWQAWNGWGGDAGFSWAKKVVGQMEARDKKTEFVAGRDCGQDEGGTFGPDNKCAVGYGRPAIKGGYKPTRPGGKIVPKSQINKPLPPPPPSGKPAPPKPLPPKPSPEKEQKPEKSEAIKKYEAKLKEFGIKNVDLPDNEKVAETITREAGDLHKRGYELVDSLGKKDYVKEYGDDWKGTLAAAGSGEVGGKLYQSINYNTSDLEKYDESVEKAVSSGLFSANNTFAHEHAHIEHARNLGTKRFVRLKNWATSTKTDRIKIAEEVSRYAKTNPLEFVSETFAGHISGKKYSKRVYDMYEYYGGPKLK
jgi:hypothetical protein